MSCFFFILRTTIHVRCTFVHNTAYIMIFFFKIPIKTPMIVLSKYCLYIFPIIKWNYALPAFNKDETKKQNKSISAYSHKRYCIIFFLKEYFIVSNGDTCVYGFVHIRYEVWCTSFFYIDARMQFYSSFFKKFVALFDHKNIKGKKNEW